MMKHITILALRFYRSIAQLFTFLSNPLKCKISQNIHKLPTITKSYNTLTIKENLLDANLIIKKSEVFEKSSRKIIFPWNVCRTRNSKGWKKRCRKRYFFFGGSLVLFASDTTERETAKDAGMSSAHSHPK